MAEEMTGESAAGLTHPSVDFERTDISIRNVILTGVGVVGLVWIASFTCYFVFFHYARIKAAASAGYPGMAAYGRSLPPEPRLQQSPPADYRQMLAADESQLHSYHWVDRSRGVVSIPIEQAIDLTAQQGIPSQPAPPGNVYYLPRAGDRLTGFEEREQGEPR